MYEGFAYVYDKLTADIDYSKWADYIESIFEKTGAKPKSLVDLGCGTGSFCSEMAARGYSVIGIDRSADMLSCAKNKAIEKGLDVLYIQQDMADFELFEATECIVSLLDSVNYITDKRKLKRMFRRVRENLKTGGLFIFDINTQYKFEKVLGNNFFYDLGDDVICLWQNRYDEKRKICEFDLTLLVREGSLYRRWDEIHRERAYTAGEITDALEAEKLQIIGVYDNLTFDTPGEKSERIFFVCRKP